MLGGSPARTVFCVDFYVNQAIWLKFQADRGRFIPITVAFNNRIDFMGFLDSLFGGVESSTTFSPQDAFAGILLGASGCDGHIADDEVQNLATCLLRMKLYQRMQGKQFGQMLNKLHSVLKKRGVEALIDQCVQTLPNELRNAAFTNAVDIVLADGVVEPDEKQFIEMLQGRLGIDNNTARLIVDIMVSKNKG